VDLCVALARNIVPQALFMFAGSKPVQAGLNP